MHSTCNAQAHGDVCITVTWSSQGTAMHAGVKCICSLHVKNMVWIWENSPSFDKVQSNDCVRAVFNESNRLFYSSCPLVRSHACETDLYGKPGGCSHICLLSGSYKSRTCRCRTGFSMGSDGQYCKSQCHICPSSHYVIYIVYIPESTV